MNPVNINKKKFLHLYIYSYFVALFLLLFIRTSEVGIIIYIFHKGELGFWELKWIIWDHVILRSRGRIQIQYSSKFRSFPIHQK